MNRPLIFILFFPYLRIYCEILTSNLSEIIQNDEVRRLVQEFAELCEGTVLCEVNVTASEISLTDRGLRAACCEPCSCHNGCYPGNKDITGQCCPDIILRVLDQAEVKIKEENAVRCTQVDYPLIPLTASFIDGYEMVSKCSSSYINTNVREKCEQDYSNTTMIGADVRHIIPVLAAEKNTPYKNIHCAICNEINITDVHYWASEITCSANLPFLFHNSQYSVQVFHDRPDCSLHYTAPEGSRRCTYLIDRCNVTGLYIAEDPFLERACASYTSVYKNYKNIHCYLCNGNSEDSIAEECLFSNEMSSTVRFIGILDFGETFPGLQTENEKSGSCGLSSIFDKLTNTCRPIFCSEMMRLSGLRCEPYYSQASPISYEIRFRVIPRFDLTGLDTALNLAYKIFEKLTTILNNGQLKSCVYVCSIHLNITEDKLHSTAELNNASVSQIDVELSTMHQDRSSIPYVSTDIKSLINAYETKYTDMGDFTVEYIANEHDFDRESPHEESDRTYKSFPQYSEIFLNQYYVNKLNLVTISSALPSKDFLLCHTSVHVSYLQTCAKVVIPNDTFVHNIGENKMAEVNVLDEAVEFNEVVFITDTEKIIICAEKYLELVDKKMRRNKNIDGPSPVSQSVQPRVQLRLLSLTFLLKIFLSTQ